MVPSTGINNTVSITREAAGLTQVYPDSDSKNPRIGNYSADGQWNIPKSKLEKFNEEYNQNQAN
jgi:hypothetical protein